MSIATEQEQLDYFYKRVESIKQSKLYAKHALIPEEYLVPTREEMVQALIDGSATLDDKNYGGVGAIFVNQLNWPERSKKDREHKEKVTKAQEDYNAYELALSRSISKIVDQVVLGKLKPLDAIEQLEKLA